jgi:hypothetical protein
MNHRFACDCEKLEVFAKPSVTFKPGKRSFDNPPFVYGGKIA